MLKMREEIWELKEVRVPMVLTIGEFFMEKVTPELTLKDCRTGTHRHF